MGGADVTLICCVICFDIFGVMLKHFKIWRYKNRFLLKQTQFSLKEQQDLKMRWIPCSGEAVLSTQQKYEQMSLLLPDLRLAHSQDASEFPAHLIWHLNNSYRKSGISLHEPEKLDISAWPQLLATVQVSVNNTGLHHMDSDLDL